MVGLLSDRMRPHYADIGLLKYEDVVLEEIRDVESEVAV
jgi:hypothetical protein